MAEAVETIIFIVKSQKEHLLFDRRSTKHFSIPYLVKPKMIRIVTSSSPYVNTTISQ